jgi:HD superfamily phosphodiesterase
MKDEKLILKLKEIAIKKMSGNKRFHDQAHILSVFKNAEEIIKKEKSQNKVDSLVILTAALFHDLSDYDGGIKEGLDGAKNAKDILEKINEFPKEKIKDVERLIISLESKDKTNLDEKILQDADSLDALSKLGICRSFMLLSKRGMNLQEAAMEYYKYIKRKEKNRFFTKSSKIIAKKRIGFFRKFSEECKNMYN